MEKQQVSHLNESLVSQISEIQHFHSQLSPLEHLIDKVNGQGRYQLVSFLIFSFMWFVASWLLVGQAFFFDSSYECTMIDDKQKCSQYICSLSNSQRKTAINTHADSIVFAFDYYLLCQNDYIISVLQSMLFIGSLLGFFAIPYFADNWGRRKAIRISWGICTLGVAGICFADSVNMVGIGYFFAGFGVNPAITLCYSFINEQCLGKKRQLYGVAIQVFLALGEGVVAFVFLSRLHWYQIGYIMLLLFFMINFMIIYLVESPKFLVKFNKQQTLDALNIIARRNSRQLITLQQIQKLNIASQCKQDGGASLSDLFKYKSLRWTTISTGIVFLGIQVIYYSTSLNLGSVGDSKVMNQQIIALAEGMGYISAELLISKINRKRFSFIGMGLSSLMCFFLATLNIVESQQNHSSIVIAQTVGLLMNRFVLCITWAIFYVYIAELFPTRVRSLGFGWTSALGTIGSSLSPYMNLISDQIGINTWIIPGLFGTLAVFSIAALKQTFGKPLQDQIVQLKQESITKQKLLSENEQIMHGQQVI